MFNFGVPVSLDNKQLSSSIIVLPVSKKSHELNLPVGSRIAGLRFEKGVGSILFNQVYSEPTELTAKEDRLNFSLLVQLLKANQSHYYQLRMLYSWALGNFEESQKLPDNFVNSLEILVKYQSINVLNQELPLSQRQVERHYRKCLDMTPNQFLRLMRVNKVKTTLKHSPDTDLVSLALEHGFADQSHMTREFQSLARTTPKQYVRFTTTSQL